MILSRILAVFAAVLLVGSVAAALLLPQTMSLYEGLGAVNASALGTAESWLRAHVSVWMWEHPFRAVLTRPTWMLPAMVGLVCAGGAATRASMQKTPTTRRRRS